MRTAKLVTDGESQSVQLPADCRLEGDEVHVKKHQGLVILFSKDDPWVPLLASLDAFSEDFMRERRQPSQQGRRESEGLG